MFEIHRGSQELKSLLELLLHEKGSKETGLEDFLEDLEKTETTPHSWWCLVNAENEPCGALTVRYLDNLSFVRAVWTRVFKYNEVHEASIQLLKTWLENPRKGTTKFQIDLPSQSPLVESLYQIGFQKEKALLTSYNVTTDWFTESLPENYKMRPVGRDELSEIYYRLISPDLDKASPIYVPADGFISFGSNLPDSAMKSWVVVEDDEEELTGFGGSFLSIEGEETNAILYGPHSKEPQVLRALIGEMAAYWKSKDIDNLRILRVAEFHPDIVSHFNMMLSYQLIRFAHLKK